MNAGGLYTDLRNDAKAINYYNRAIKIQPKNFALTANIGWLTELQGKLEEARDYYLRALDILSPETHTQIKNNLRNVEAKIEQERTMKEAAKASNLGHRNEL